MYNRRWHGIKREKLAKKLHTLTHAHSHIQRNTHTHEHTTAERM